jgi:ketosteroid isomerase-like protein
LREEAMKALAALVLLVGLGLPLSDAQWTDADAESKLIALERIQKLQAFKARDLKTLDDMFDDAFVNVDLDGRTRTKAEILAYIQGVDSLRYTPDAMVVRLHGDTAIVTGLFQVSGVERGKPFSQRGRFVDTWLYKNGRWIALASLSTPTGE